MIFIGGYLFLFTNGKSFVTERLEKLTKRRVKIGHFNVIPPINLEIKELEIKDLFNADYIYVSPSMLGILMGSLAFNAIEIVRPEFYFEKLPAEPKAEQAEAPAAAAPEVSAPQGELVEPKPKQPLHLALKRFRIKDGKAHFIDRSIGPNSIKVNIENITVSLANLYVLPLSAVVNFEVKGEIPWEQEGTAKGKISADGWINFYKRDMEASLKIEDIDGVYLYPYYSKWVDLEKARIEKAKLNFTSNLHGLNNNITAECHLELTDIVRRPLQPDESEAKAAKIADVLIEAFKALNQGKIVLDFTIRTRMDSPEFGFGNIKDAFENKFSRSRNGGATAEGIFMLPGKIVGGTFKGLTDMTVAVVTGTISAGKEIGRAAVGAFKKDR
jgi:hypothetical protein